MRTVRQIACSLSLLCAGTFAASGASAETPSLSTYGLPGLIDLPTAEALDDGALAFGLALTEQTFRGAASFQVLPWLGGTFRYAGIDDYLPDGSDTKDRSFDVQIQLREEDDVLPAVALGLRDVLGTGLYSGEYIVATKGLGSDITASVGLGWGRIAGRNTFENPLTFLDASLAERDLQFDATGGQFRNNVWFSGPTAFFGGVDWKVSDRLSLQVEYSPDVYRLETNFSDTRITTPINAALSYTFGNAASAKAFVFGGENFGLQFNFVIDSKEPFIEGSRAPAPNPILPRSSVAAASWNSGGPTDTAGVLEQKLRAEGIDLEGFELRSQSATVFIENGRWNVAAQAAGRVARVMANVLPPQIEEFTVVFQQRGLPLSNVTTQRSDLEELQFDYDASWRSLARADIADTQLSGQGASKLSYDLGPYTSLSFFDPQRPVRYDIGVQLDLSYRAAPGLTFDGVFRYPLFGNLGESTRESDSVIQRVRSESSIFARESDFEVNRLTAEYMWRPASDVFARVTGGYLESQFGGISTELLWAPINSRLSLGVEVNYVRQRDFDMLFGFQDYDVVTGHASGYYDLGNGFYTQVDVGRYLAGDWGGTFTLKREFNNGVKVGGYFTLTDVPFDDFGEGAFDKGLQVEIPFTFFTGQPSRRTFTQSFQPILRDGGARLSVENRLFPFVRDARGSELSDGWAGYLR